MPLLSLAQTKASPFNINIPCYLFSIQKKIYYPITRTRLQRVRIKYAFATHKITIPFSARLK
jgi:hypothetical protein